MTPKPRDPPLPKTLFELLGFLLSETDRSEVDAGRVIEQILRTVRLLAILLVIGLTLMVVGCGLGGFVVLVVKGRGLNLEPLAHLNPIVTAVGGAVATLVLALIARALGSVGIRGVGRLLRRDRKADPPAVTSSDV